ncbi:MAG: radical SAM protein [Euryarchaeota archaeon]|nr:radical SAM protein [Euryarchaeota archaeon]MDE1835652.1 radical SAM protein [Euryarchaeota archaeon]MDE1879000.1 radical SAM protein [Euryarchaeota archaeon]MDE2043726.1 radical SAM protein [Thermoplasmata archaeon]
MLPADVEVSAGARDLSSGALLDLLGGLRHVRDGELVALVGSAPHLREHLARWSQLTGHRLVEVLELPDGNVRYVVRKGPLPRGRDEEGEVEEGPGERLWIYSNFQCNLACDYCCVRSSPRVAPRALPTRTVRDLARQAEELRFHRILVTGGEPFLSPALGETLRACLDHLPTTVLTNGTLLSGPRGRLLSELPRDRLVLQVSLDSPTPERHDQHRGAGSWARAWDGIERARRMGFRVRVAATLSEEEDRERMEAWLESRGFSPRDRVVRPLARRGLANLGLALARADVVPEVTVTAQGVYWHPVGADDEDFLVCRPLGNLSEAVERIQQMWNEERGGSERLSEVFHCA